VNVTKRGRHVANSPFRIMVGESEIGDASKVKVYGDGIEKASAGECAEFNVDTRKAGEWNAYAVVPSVDATSYSRRHVGHIRMLVQSK